MRKIKKLSAILLSVMMLVCMFGATANAATSMTEATLQKYVEMDGYVTKYPSMTFKFDIKQLTGDAIPEGIVNKLGGINNFGAATVKLGTDEIISATVAGAERNESTTGNFTTPNTTGQAKIALNVNDYKVNGVIAPGYYVYEIKEKVFVWDATTNVLQTSKDSVWEKETGKTLYFVVSVGRDYDIENEKPVYKDGYIIDSALAYKLTTKDDSETAEKVKLEFTNYYQTYDDDGNEEIVITKKVTGNKSSITDNFEFELKITRNGTDTLTGYDVIKNVKTVNADGTITYNPTEQEDISVTADGEPITYKFTLQDGESLKVVVPVGTKYTVTELDDTKGYKASYDLVSGSVYPSDNPETGTATSAGAALTADDVVRIGENYVNFTNEKDSGGPNTGIVTDNLSFILLIVVAAAGMTAYVVMKRRFRSL